MNSKESTDGTGFMNVRKRIRNNKIVWRYTKTINGEKLDVSSRNLFELKNKVVSKGFPWKIIDKTLADKSMEENDDN